MNVTATNRPRSHFGRSPLRRPRRQATTTGRTRRRWAAPFLSAVALALVMAAVLANGVTPGSGASTGALQFDGVNDYATFGVAPGLNTAAFTLETWFKWTGGGATTTTGGGGLPFAIPLVTKGAAQAETPANVNANYLLVIGCSASPCTTGKLAADFEDTATGLNHPVTGIATITINVWHHAAATYDGTTWRLYLDGVLDQTLVVGAFTPELTSIQHAALATTLTSTGTAAGFFAGVLDEARIWNVARSGSDILASKDTEIASAANLIGRWGINEGSGTVVGDSSGSGVTGAATNGPIWVFPGAPITALPTPTPTATIPPGIAALRFDGTNDYVTFGAAPGLGTATFTIETWFNRTGAGVGANTGTGGLSAAIPLVSKGGAEAETPRNVNMNYFLGIDTGTGALAGDFEDTSTGVNHPVIGTTVVTSNVWHHAAATYDGTTWRLYLDGVLDKTLVVGAFTPEFTSIQHAALGTTRNSTGAAPTTPGWFAGVLDEARIWNVARSGSDILTSKDTEIASAANLIGRWGMNEGSGTSVTDSSSSGSGVNGTATNGPIWVSPGAPFATGGTPTPTGTATNTPTATPTVSPDDVVFVGAGDIADCARTQDEATALLLDGFPTDPVFTLGDNVYPNGTAAEFTNCYDPTWGRHKARTRPLPGNHDYNTANATGYYGYFGAAAGDPAKGYYSYDLGSYWHVVVLNGECVAAPNGIGVTACDAGSAQEQWLRADLAANASKNVVSMWHKPIFSSGTYFPVTMPLWKALYDYGAEINLVGHDHDYERFAPLDGNGLLDTTYGIRPFVVGTGGAAFTGFGATEANSEVRNNSTYGILKLTLHPASYDWQFIPIAGQTFTDSGTTAVHGAPPSSATATPTNTAMATNTPTNTPTPVGDPVFVGVGDMASCLNDNDEATALLVDGIPGQVFTIGDNVYEDGTAAEFANCYDPTWGRHKGRTRPASGNHDYNTAGATGYFDYFNGFGQFTGPAGDRDKGYYSYDVGPYWHVVVLNSECTQIGGCTVGSPQEVWLRADLIANASKNVIAILHKPLFSSAGNITTTQDLWQALYDNGVEMMLTGHFHHYERFAPLNASLQPDNTFGVREFVIGTGGINHVGLGATAPYSEALDNTTYGVMKFTLHPTSYDWQFIPVAGQTFTDSGTTAVHGVPPPSTPTPTRTATSTPTATNTPTDTPSPTNTPTPTDTPTKTATATPAADADADGIVDSSDNCPVNYNPAQTNTDEFNYLSNRPGSDGLGDACDPDISGDGYGNVAKAALGKDLLVYCPIMRADVHIDGKVDLGDLIILAGHYGQNVPPAPARDDQTADNKITLADLILMANVYLMNVSACP